jgi:molybdenum cofactor biosynthesis enzyme
MIPIHLKTSTHRTATAVGKVSFSNPTAVKQIHENSNKKGDVLALARISGIMAAKKTPEIVVLCHPIPVSSVEVGVDVSAAVPAEGEEQGHPVPMDAGAGVVPASSSFGEEEWKPVEGNGRIEIRATVTCDGKTGVEMEALAAVMGAALAVVDMCKAVDRGIEIFGVRVVEKRGGRSGDWVDGKKVE